jgi:molybdopterin-guanine dinucleotide biosynthesis protein A
VKVTAIVLAGGRASRFGSPKLATEIDGVPLLERAIQAVVRVAAEVVVAGGVPEEALAAGTHAGAAGSAIRLVADESPFEGPLMALAGALRHVDSELAIVVGGDMPGLVPAVLGAMLDRLRSDPEIEAVMLASDASKQQVLPLAIRVESVTIAAAAAVDAGDRSLVRLVAGLQNAEIPASEWRTFDPRGTTLLDVDEPADLERMQKELR